MKKYFLVLILLIITVGFCYLSLYYFVLSNKLAYKDAGPIGDMFAGLTMPIITLVSILLLFFSFREQLEANKIQTKALQEEIKRSNTLKELDQILDLLGDIKKEFSELIITYEDEKNRYRPTTVTGENTIFYFDELEEEFEFLKYISELAKAVELLSFVCEKTETYEFEIRDENVVYEKIRLIYSEKFDYGVNKFTLVAENIFVENTTIQLRRLELFTHRNIVHKYLNKFNKKLVEDTRIKGAKKIEELKREIKIK
jgi:hypothetical protein